MTICVALPICDSEAFMEETLLSVASAQHVLVVDNASKDQSLVMIQQLAPTAKVISFQNRLDRIASWQRTADTFLQQPFAWMKWLFAGDVINVEALNEVHKVVKEYPEAKLAICNYIAVEKDKKWLWKPPQLKKTQLLYPKDSQLLAAQHGNWFGPPLAHLVHRDALNTARIPTGLSWCADGAFCLEIASKHPVLYLDIAIGEFRAVKRRYFSTRSGSPEAIFEDSLLRLRAAEAVKEHASHPHLISAIQFDAAKRLILRKDMNIFQRLASKAKRFFTTPKES
jgi:hypothetical protein